MTRPLARYTLLPVSKNEFGARPCLWPPGEPFTPEERRVILHEFEAGASSYELSRKFRRTTVCIEDVLREALRTSVRQWGRNR